MPIAIYSKVTTYNCDRRARARLRMARFVEPISVITEPVATTVSQISLHMEEVIASSRRLWLRGQVVGLPQPFPRVAPKDPGPWALRLFPPPPLPCPP